MPLPRHLVLGGRVVTAIFGVPPLWGPVPLVLVALADAEHYHVTVIPGHGFAAPRERLDERLRELFEPAGAARRAVVPVEPRLAPAELPREAAYAKR